MIALCAAAAASAQPTFHRKPSIQLPTFKDYIRQADEIVIGRVRSVRVVQTVDDRWEGEHRRCGHAISRAEVVPEELFQPGNMSARVVFFTSERCLPWRDATEGALDSLPPGWGPWVLSRDGPWYVSQALEDDVGLPLSLVEGERALLFLVRVRNPSDFSWAPILAIQGSDVYAIRAATGRGSDGAKFSVTGARGRESITPDPLMRWSIRPGAGEVIVRGSNSFLFDGPEAEGLSTPPGSVARFPYLESILAHVHGLEKPRSVGLAKFRSTLASLRRELKTKPLAVATRTNATVCQDGSRVCVGADLRLVNADGAPKGIRVVAATAVTDKRRFPLGRPLFFSGTRESQEITLSPYEELDVNLGNTAIPRNRDAPPLTAGLDVLLESSSGEQVRVIAEQTQIGQEPY